MQLSLMDERSRLVERQNSHRRASLTRSCRADSVFSFYGVRSPSFHARRTNFSALIRSMPSANLRSNAATHLRRTISFAESRPMRARQRYLHRSQLQPACNSNIFTREVKVRRALPAVPNRSCSPRPVASPRHLFAHRVVHLPFSLVSRNVFAGPPTVRDKLRGASGPICRNMYALGDERCLAKEKKRRARPQRNRAVAQRRRK